MANSSNPLYTPIRPCGEEVEKQLNNWLTLDKYVENEEHLKKLFVEKPSSTDSYDVDVKARYLDSTYSTSVKYMNALIHHIVSLENIDERIMSGDESIVNEIADVYVESKNINIDYFSFATKYCHHHNPDCYPIYDHFVADVLYYFNKEYKFSKFTKKSLRDVHTFKRVINDFTSYFELTNYSVREIDKYLWLLGKEIYPSNKKDGE